LRKALGLTQLELARRIGIFGPALSRIERGKANPTLRTLTEIAQALGVPVFDLFADDGVPAEAVELTRRVRALPTHEVAALLVIIRERRSTD
jgi:transcriptional regulator with XRE-family HTH domain